ncbi:1000_t:CDS:10 [Gigaspora rosea]|nr:1000_t:CDS:10 [Gigaspora rosea]
MKRYAGPNLKNFYRTQLSRRCISPISETAILVTPPPCDICAPPPSSPPCDICAPPPSSPPCGCKPPQVISHDQLSSNEFEGCSENEHELQCCCDESLGQKSYESCNDNDLNLGIIESTIKSRRARESVFPSETASSASSPSVVPSKRPFKKGAHIRTWFQRKSKAWASILRRANRVLDSGLYRIIMNPLKANYVLNSGLSSDHYESFKEPTEKLQTNEGTTPSFVKKKSVKEGTRDVVGGAKEAVDAQEDVLTFDKDKFDDHEKAEALIIVEESATPEKCKDIVSNQKDDGSIELVDTICNELDVPKEEINKTIQKKTKNTKLRSMFTNKSKSEKEKKSRRYEIMEQQTRRNRRAINNDVFQNSDKKSKNNPKKKKTYLNLDKFLRLDDDHKYKSFKNYNIIDMLLPEVNNSTIRTYKGQPKKEHDDNKYKSFNNCDITDMFLPEVNNSTIRTYNGHLDSSDSNRISIATILYSSNQKDDGFFEISDTVCKEIYVPVADVVPTVKKYTQNKKLKLPNSEPWWKTALTLSYLKVAAPHHKNYGKIKGKKAREYLSEQIGDTAAEKELLDRADK